MRDHGMTDVQHAAYLDAMTEDPTLLVTTAGDHTLRLEGHAVAWQLVQG